MRGFPVMARLNTTKIMGMQLHTMPMFSSTTLVHVSE
jgi:hypothetical protein